MFILRTILFFLCIVSAASADCNLEEDINPEFAKSLKLAKKGNVIEQRNIAVSYEVGYLVSRCFDRAYFWYGKAAKNKDDISIEWMARQDTLIKLHDGREFMTVYRGEKLLHVAAPPLSSQVQPANVEQPKKMGHAESLYYSVIFGGL